jgi:hypothetical protein
VTVILRTIFRAVWVATSFIVAAAVALAVLFALGAVWAGDELRAAAPDDPLLEHGAPVLSAVLFAGTVGPALTASPGLIAVIAGEVLKVRSWMYYVPARGAALAAIPVLAASPAADPARIIAGQTLTIFAAAGFAGGFVYWLLAGSRA